MHRQNSPSIFNDAQLIHTQEKTRRGEANALRKGVSKIHRRYTPVFNDSVPRGAAGQVVARMRNHDWKRNQALCELRKSGYTPFKKRTDPNFVPKPMRITPRSECREALTALSLALAANCNYDPTAEYPFEVMCSIEDLARSMGVLHVYEDGRKAYDILLNALSVIEQLNYCVVHREIDPDVGQYKPIRMWLTPEFFLSRGFQMDEVRELLNKYRQWAIKNGLSESLKKKYQRHLLRMARLGIDIERRYSLKNLLRKIKRQVVSADLQDEKKAAVVDIGQYLDKLAKAPKKIKKASLTPYETAYQRWAESMPRSDIYRMKWAIEKEYPDLRGEAYYKLLLERAGAI
ncbi:Replication protein [Yersinia massiliensis]|uniref:Replication protein n=1 Tax=Yersinia massiliensis TaxID=419257 RepID=A0ABM6V0P3_9GAMM|nr:Replication protein [Yersinia massiliensis]AVX40744.1 Replication protein [Yersinia massiliensis]